jgi:hypothetical protein
MKEKARRAAAFLFWYSQISFPEVRFALILYAWTKLSSSLCKHAFFFVFPLFFFIKKKGWRKMQIFIPYLAFQISYVFLPDVLVLSALIIYFYISESSCLISTKFSCCIYLIDSYFFHVMKMCTIQGSPKVHFFLL